ncbi:hypothetical protein DVDV_0606 [Desulfovibrio sp. DV]|uniref:PRC-barrel domain-containing protein n=1 Tax=Desulfovibrio sp. DV TaxID=1844708 RepID=UPI00094B9565|nr:PRC-barrel domain-containing protein [Desulfovibrio sp. DV]OLN30406.1 hypothetical protein DVDV_0606 [Desulfovibrio sp. DV]
METNKTYMPSVDTSFTTDDLSTVMKGWSVKDDILGKDIYNDNNDNIGTIEDLYVTRDKAISYAILGVGGFLGMGRHDVAIPVYQLRMTDDQIILPGATKDSLMAMKAID